MPPSNQRKVRLSFLENLCLAGGAAACSKIVSTPLENIKIRKQLIRYPCTSSSTGKVYSGTTLGIFQQLNDEGFFLGIMGGVVPNVLRYYPTQTLNFAFKDSIKSYFKPGKDSSFFKKILYNTISGTLAGTITLGVVYGMDRWRTVSALPSECVIEPSTYYQMYSGFGVSLLGLFVYRGSYFGIYDMVGSIRQHVSSFWGRFTLGYSVTSIAGLIVYPLDTIRRTQMINCCTASKAISIIHGHPDGLWEGYMGGWKENVIRGLLGTMVLITFDYFKELYINSVYPNGGGSSTTTNDVDERPLIFNVTAPEGSSPGQVINVQTEVGVMRCQIPPGVQAGQVFQIRAPPEMERAAREAQKKITEERNKHVDYIVAKRKVGDKVEYLVHFKDSKLKDEWIDISRKSGVYISSKKVQQYKEMVRGIISNLENENGDEEMMKLLKDKIGESDSLLSNPPMLSRQDSVD